MTEDRSDFWSVARRADSRSNSAVQAPFVKSGGARATQRIATGMRILRRVIVPPFLPFLRSACPKRCDSARFILAVRQAHQGIAMTRALRTCLSFALLVGCLVTAAMAAETSVIVDTAYVADAIKRNAIVWDVRGAGAYKQGHIPGAVNIDDIGVVLRDENTEDYIAQEDIERLLGGAGIDPSREVVVYGAKANPYVYFGLV